MVLKKIFPEKGEKMIIRCSDGGIINPNKIEFYGLCDREDGITELFALSANNRYVLYYSRDRKEMERHHNSLFNVLKNGIKNDVCIDFVQEIRNRRKS